MNGEGQINFKNIQAVIGDIKISGAVHTNTEYITHQFQEIFKVNNFEDLVSQTAQLRERLIKLGTFKQVDTLVDVSSSNKPNAYDILIHVHEKNLIGGGLHTSIGNNDGSVNSKIFCPNLFGNGENLGCEYGYGTNNHIDYRVYYSSPVDMNPNKQFSVSGFQSSNDFPWSKYKQFDNGITFEFAKPFDWVLENKYTISGNHSFVYEGSWRQIISSLDSAFNVREQSGHSLKSSFKYTNQIDKRDHSVLPTSGAYQKTTAELAGIGGDVRFLKANFDYQISKTFFQYLTAQFTFSKGFVLPWKKNTGVSISDKFFLGGPLTLRGFKNRGAGPQIEECALGNSGYWLVGAHLYTPLPFLHKQKGLSSWLKTHSFVNMGNIFSLNSLKSINKENLFENTRLSVGSGLVIGFGQMARLELNYVYPLWKSQYDKSITGLQFGIGIVFN